MNQLKIPFGDFILRLASGNAVFAMEKTMNKRYAIILGIILAAWAAAAPAFGDAAPTGPSGRSFTPRIVGGQVSVPGAWPWMTALVYSDDSSAFYGHFCGAALIRPNWLLTAAHCVEGMRPSELEAVVGAHDLKNDPAERIGVQEILMHPDYDPYSLDSDIALVALSRSLSGETVPPIASGTDLAGETGIALGWGYTDPDRLSPSETLQQAALPIVSNLTCNTAFNAYTGYPYDDPITGNMVCAGDLKGGKDACIGDSGGPLMVLDGDAWRLAGLVSWGEGCAEPDLYGVYTRVGPFLDFINENVKVSPLYGQVTTDFAGQSGLGVANATVALEGTPYTAVTDAEGRFVLDAPPGGYSVRIEADGLAPLTEQVTLSTVDGVELNRRMTPPPAGDFNGNGRLDMGDVIGLLRTLAGAR
jgi:secreted trypsin-like serine protease